MVMQWFDVRHGLHLRRQVQGLLGVDHPGCAVLLLDLLFEHEGRRVEGLVAMLVSNCNNIINDIRPRLLVTADNRHFLLLVTSVPLQVAESEPRLQCLLV